MATIEAIARMLAVKDPRTALVELDKANVPFVRIGRRRRYQQSAIDRFIEAKTCLPAESKKDRTARRGTSRGKNQEILSVLAQARAILREPKGT